MLVIRLNFACHSVAALTFFAWTTSDGGLAFTDEVKRIPAKYKDSAVEREWQKLRDDCRCTKAQLAVFEES